MATSSYSLLLRALEDVDMACNACLSLVSNVERDNLSDVHLLSNRQQNDRKRLKGDGLSQTGSNTSGLVDKGPTIDDLPDELMLEIFKYVNFRDNINSLQKVCTRWKVMAQDAQLWYHFKYVVRHQSASDVIATFAAVPQLRTVIMDEVSPRVFEALARSCPHLTTLQIQRKLTYSEAVHLFDGCKEIRSLTVLQRCFRVHKSFTYVVARLADLRVLHLCGSDDDERKAILLRSLADGCPHLCDLHLGRDGGVDYWIEDAEYFLSSHRHVLQCLGIGWTSVEGRCITPLLATYLDRLESLELTDYDVDDCEVAAEAITALGRLHSLRELSFGVGDLNVYHLVPTVFENGSLSKLQKLCLRGFVPDEVTRVLAQHCPELRELELKGCGEHTDALFEPLCRLEKLEILKINGCYCLYEEAMFYIAKLPALHSLSFSYTKFDDLQPSVDCILEMCGLQRLSFTECSCSAIPFDKFPVKLVNLRELELVHCGVSQDDLDRITAQMPDLKVKSSLWAPDTLGLVLGVALGRIGWI